MHRRAVARLGVVFGDTCLRSGFAIQMRSSVGKRRGVPMKQTAGRRTALWTLLFWGIVGGGSYLLGVQLELGQRAENSVLDAADFTTQPPPPLNLVSVPMIGVSLVVIGMIAFFAHGMRRALVVVIIPGLGIAASQLLKLELLTRPELFEFDVPNTFPSGHMTVFTVLIGGLVWAVPARLRALVVVIGTAVLGAAAWQLLEYGWHRPSDVFGGLALGVIAFAVACVLKPATARGTVTLGQAASIGLALCGWALIAGALLLALWSWMSGRSALMLGSGQFGAIGLSALAARALLRLGSGKK